METTHSRAKLTVNIHQRISISQLSTTSTLLNSRRHSPAKVQNTQHAIRTRNHSLPTSTQFTTNLSSLTHAISRATSLILNHINGVRLQKQRNRTTHRHQPYTRLPRPALRIQRINSISTKPTVNTNPHRINSIHSQMITDRMLIIKRSPIRRHRRSPTFNLMTLSHSQSLLERMTRRSVNLTRRQPSPNRLRRRPLRRRKTPLHVQQRRDPNLFHRPRRSHTQFRSQRVANFIISSHQSTTVKISHGMPILLLLTNNRIRRTRLMQRTRLLRHSQSLISVQHNNNVRVSRNITPEITQNSSTQEPPKNNLHTDYSNVTHRNPTPRAITR